MVRQYLVEIIRNNSQPNRDLDSPKYFLLEIAKAMETYRLTLIASWEEISANCDLLFT